MKDTRPAPPAGIHGRIPDFNARAVQTRHTLWIECAPGHYWFRATQPRSLTFQPDK